MFADGALMPWSVKRDSRCPTSKPYGVVLESDGSLEGCHASRVGAREQQAALYASEATKGLGFVPAKAFKPEQPRWPQGHPAGGKWRSQPTAEDLQAAKTAIREALSHLRATGNVDPDVLKELEQKFDAVLAEASSSAD